MNQRRPPDEEKTGFITGKRKKTPLSKPKQKEALSYWE